MKEIYLNCDSPCLSCLDFGRVIKISDFSQRKLPNAYYCSACDIYFLCKKGVAFSRTVQGNLQPTCTKCGRYLQSIELSYEEGFNEHPFKSDSIIVVRKANGEGFSILRSLKGAFFNDLAELFLYLLYVFGPDKYNLVNYDPSTKRFNEIYDGEIAEDKVILRFSSPTNYR